MLKRKTQAETDRKKKISLPAALFNRSPLKNVENSSMISNTSFTNEPPCQNHPNKKGKYSVISEQIEEDQQTFYCQKCAILLASKGFEVKKLQLLSTDTKTTQKKKNHPRDQQLTTFIKQIQKKIKELKQVKRLSAEQLSQIQEAYEAKVQKIQSFFEELFHLLSKYKNKQVHETSLRKKSLQEQLATHLGYVTQRMELLQTMKQDIVSSRDSIVVHTPQQDYQLVMSHYRSNVEQIKCEPVSASLDDQVLPSIDTIQSLLFQLFEKGQHGPNFSFDSSSKKPYE